MTSHYQLLKLIILNLNSSLKSLQYCLHNWAIFISIRPSQLGEYWNFSIRPAELAEYWKIKTQLPEQYGKFTLPILPNLDKYLKKNYNICMMTWVRIYGEIETEPLKNLSGTTPLGFSWVQTIFHLVIIYIQYLNVCLMNRLGVGAELVYVYALHRTIEKSGVANQVGPQYSTIFFWKMMQNSQISHPGETYPYVDIKTKYYLLYW